MKSESHEMNDEQRKLVEDNITLVYSLVNKEYPTFVHDDDIIQSGILGLCKAAMKWDSSKGAFSTLAFYCIRNEIRLELRSRQRRVETVSLETPVEDNLTLEDMLEGGDDTDITELMVDAYVKTLTEDERTVLELKLEGYKRQQIINITGFDLNKVKSILRMIRIKYIKYLKSK